MKNSSVSPAERPPTFWHVVASLALGALFLITVGVNLLAPILAWQWVHQPFIGVLLEHTLVVGSDEPAWPGHQAGLRRPERILAADDQPVHSSAELYALLRDRQPGETVVYTVESEDERGGWTTRQVAVPLSTFPPSQFIVNFVVPYLIAVAYLVAGMWVYWRRPQTRIRQAFAVFCWAMAIVTGTMFDLSTTHWLMRAWCAALPLVAAALIHLALVCPQEREIVRRWPALSLAPYLPALVLVAINEFYLYHPANPRAYSLPWLASYVFLGLGMMVFVSLLIYTRQRPASSVVRQQVRIILLGTALAFGPTAVWIVVSLLARLFPALGLHVAFQPALNFPPLVLFPMAIAYAILYYRQLNVDLVISRGLVYISLTVLILAMYFVLITVASQVFHVTAPASNPVILALFIIALSMTLNPVRDRLQRLINRFFFKERPGFEEIMRDFGRALTATLELPVLLEMLLARVRSTLQIRRAMVFLADERAADYEVHRSSGDISLQAAQMVHFRDRDWLVRRLQAGEIVYLDQENMEDCPTEEQARLRTLGVALNVPLRTKARLVGWLALGPKESGDLYNHDDLFLLTAMADQTAIAVENSQLYEKQVVQSRNLARQAQQLTDILHLGNTLKSLNPDIVLQQTVDAVSKTMGFGLVTLSLVDDEDPSFVKVVAWTGASEATWQELTNTRFPLARFQAAISDEYRIGHSYFSSKQRQLTADGFPQRIGEVREGQDWRDGDQLFVPLTGSADTLLGFLSVDEPADGRRPSREEIEVLEIFANQAAIAIENASLYERTKARARQLTTLNEVSRSITSTLDLPTVLRLIMEKVVEILEVEGGSLLLMDEDTDELVFQIALGPVEAKLEAARLPAGTGIAGTVAQTGESLIVNDVHDDPRWYIDLDLSTAFATRSILCTPLISHDTVIGVVEAINKRDGSPFDEEDLNLLTSFAAQAAIAIENARLYTMTDEKLSRRVEELSTMQEIDRQLNATLDFQQVMGLTLQWALQITHAAAGAIDLVDHERGGLLLLASQGLPDSFDRHREDPWPMSEGIAGRVARTGEVALVSDVSRDPDYVAVIGETRSQLSVPISREDLVIGVLTLESPQLSGFDEDDLAFVARLADHAAIAIENARLYNATQQGLLEIEQRAHRLAVINRVSALLSASLDLPAITRIIVTEMARITGVDQCRLVLFDEEKGYGTVQAEYVPTPDAADVHIPMADNPAYETLRDARRPLVIADARSDSALVIMSPLLKRSEARSMLLVPLVVRDQLVGLISLETTRASRTFSPAEVELCQTLANQAAIAVANARLYADVKRANEAKSEFVSLVSHELTMPMTAIKGFARLLETDSSEEMNERQREFLSVIENNVGRMQTLVNDLLDHSRLEAGRMRLELEAAPLAEVVDGVVQVVQLEVESRSQQLTVDIPPDLPPVWADRARLTQVFTNLMSNAYKYTPTGGAIQVRAELWREEVEAGEAQPMVRCAVSDTGIGIVAEDQSRMFTPFFRSQHYLAQEMEGTGLGLSIARRIVELQGGRIWLESTVGEGSTFYFTVPVAQDRAPAV
jgi:GAF domain-containing protein